MTQYVVFLRAINVAGHGSIRMCDLRDAFTAGGCCNVQSYIQSGNILFELPNRNVSAVLKNVRRELRRALGHEPELLHRTARELERIAADAPFRDWPADKRVKHYVVFLSRRPRTRPALPLSSVPEALEAVAMRDREVFVVSRPKPNGFYGFPNNFIEKELGTSATSRNWSTVKKFVELVRKNRRNQNSPPDQRR